MTVTASTRTRSGSSPNCSRRRPPRLSLEPLVDRELSPESAATSEMTLGGHRRGRGPSGRGHDPGSSPKSAPARGRHLRQLRLSYIGQCPVAAVQEVAATQLEQPARYPAHDQVQQTERHGPRSCLNSTRTQLKAHVPSSEEVQPRRHLSSPPSQRAHSIPAEGSSQVPCMVGHRVVGLGLDVHQCPVQV